MKTLFWNVDTQNDFMNPDGALYVEGAETIKPALKYITDLSKKYNIQTVNTGDWHDKNTKEISNKPDFVNTFSEHCMMHTEGAKFIEETKPDTDSISYWKPRTKTQGVPARFVYGDQVEIDVITDAKNGHNLVIYKDKFDVFEGNPHTNEILKAINPDRVIVYGVATNVCVHKAVTGLLERNIETYVVTNGIKELPNIPSPEESWYAQGAKKITTADLEKMLEE